MLVGACNPMLRPIHGFGYLNNSDAASTPRVPLPGANHSNAVGSGSANHGALPPTHSPATPTTLGTPGGEAAPPFALASLPPSTLTMPKSMSLGLGNVETCFRPVLAYISALYRHIHCTRRAVRSTSWHGGLDAGRACNPMLAWRGSRGCDCAVTVR